MTGDRSVKEVGRGNAEGGKWFQILLPGFQLPGLPAFRPSSLLEDRRQMAEDSSAAWSKIESLVLPPGCRLYYALRAGSWARIFYLSSG
jgi:hypothetical protein